MGLPLRQALEVILQTPLEDSEYVSQYPLFVKALQHLSLVFQRVAGQSCRRNNDDPTVDAYTAGAPYIVIGSDISDPSAANTRNNPKSPAKHVKTQAKRVTKKQAQKLTIEEEKERRAQKQAFALYIALDENYDYICKTLLPGIAILEDGDFRGDSSPLHNDLKKCQIPTGPDRVRYSFASRRISRESESWNGSASEFQRSKNYKAQDVKIGNKLVLLGKTRPGTAEVVIHAKKKLENLTQRAVEHFINLLRPDQSGVFGVNASLRKLQKTSRLLELIDTVGIQFADGAAIYDRSLEARRLAASKLQVRSEKRPLPAQQQRKRKHSALDVRQPRSNRCQRKVRVVSQSGAENNVAECAPESSAQDDDNQHEQISRDFTSLNEQNDREMEQTAREPLSSALTLKRKVMQHADSETSLQDPRNSREMLTAQNPTQHATQQHLQDCDSLSANGVNLEGASNADLARDHSLLLHGRRSHKAVQAQFSKLERSAINSVPPNEFASPESFNTSDRGNFNDANLAPLDYFGNNDPATLSSNFNNANLAPLNYFGNNDTATLSSNFNDANLAPLNYFGNNDTATLSSNFNDANLAPLNYFGNNDTATLSSNFNDANLAPLNYFGNNDPTTIPSNFNNANLASLDYFGNNNPATLSSNFNNANLATLEGLNTPNWFNNNSLATFVAPGTANIFNGVLTTTQWNRVEHCPRDSTCAVF